MYASRKDEIDSSSDLILAGRKIPFFVGIFTMTATWVGGGYINGTAEAVADPEQGLVWVIAPWGYAISLVLGGIFFAGKMRSLGYTTMLDPFEQRYGKKIAALLFIPALIGEIFWSSAILTALGTTFGVVLGYDFQSSILISSIVAIGYTVLGGLMAVAYTDVLQLFCILIGLAIAIPYVTDSQGGLIASWNLYGERMGDAGKIFPDWKFFFGSSGLTWIDSVFLLALGGIPWQVYFQRVLSAQSPKQARQLSYIAAIGCILMAIPSIIIGIAGATADWDSLNIEAPPSYSLILPYVLQHLTPPLIATVGLAAVAAAVMSSIDSSILSASSMFYWNIYKPFTDYRKKNPTDKQENPKEVKRVVQIGIVVIGAIATAISLQVQSVYALWFLCADLVYVVLFPQLTMALFYKGANRIGAVAGFVVSFFLRIGGGEETFGFDPFLPYPDENFPLRSFSMVMGLLTIYFVSLITQKWSKSIDLKSKFNT
ncbi:sodium:solute symporter family protein [Leptospira sp. GIMC2001]|uniref:sodium:solute symporter family protein n=1 Tax=Leptospira sp. GIMC2001 TaxID=1513297 RepID=UPI00234997C4|nr:sodium:solute symporter family protein [Leptospira sp. GIMC2001]WCL49106.1 sodium:solute symporter family protein [Leptospira sp. GIMC2001]